MNIVFYPIGSLELLYLPTLIIIAGKDIKPAFTILLNQKKTIASY